MSEIVNCEYSKTIMDEPACNAFDVNRYGEIICSEESCIILKLKEQLQAKEQECEKLKKRYNYYACGSCRGREYYRSATRSSHVLNSGKPSSFVKFFPHQQQKLGYPPVIETISWQFEHHLLGIFTVLCFVDDV